jgi:hypothetical protein
MKIYSPSVPHVWDYMKTDYTPNAYVEDQEANRVANEEAVRALGYTGKRTGKLVTDPVADGVATYMVMETPTGTINLMHMDWGDGYESRWAHRWTKKDILDMIKRREQWDEFMAGRGKVSA